MDIFGFLRSFQLNIERIVLGMFNNIIDRFQIQNNFLFVEIDDRHWYNSEGQTVAYCHSHQPKGEYTEVIYAFTYYEAPIGRPNSAPAWTPPSTSGGSNSGSVRDDYDNPEDLWEDNQDWYEDEDEAWDEWENG